MPARNVVKFLVAGGLVLSAQGLWVSDAEARKMKLRSSSDASEQAEQKPLEFYCTGDADQPRATSPQSSC